VIAAQAGIADAINCIRNPHSRRLTAIGQLALTASASAFATDGARLGLVAELEVGGLVADEGLNAAEVEGGTHCRGREASCGQLVAADACTYDVNGEQIQDLSTLMSADNKSSHLSHTWNDSYNTVGQLTQVSDGSTQTEAYQHDPQGDIISQTIANTPATTYTYSRGLLQCSMTGGQASSYNYDPLGRLETVAGPAAVEALCHADWWVPD
jgi:YD repeat-containing protein